MLFPGRHGSLSRDGLSCQKQTRPITGWSGSNDPKLRTLPPLAGVPRIHILADLVPGDPVAFLNLAFELVTSPVDDIKVVISELAPLFLDLALYLLPVAFNSVPIHATALL